MYVYSNSFHAHNQLKDFLLESIDKIDVQSVNTNIYGDKITKTDFFSDQPSSYVNDLSIHLQDHFLKVLQIPKFVLNEVWFQQYCKSDTHSWHVHEHTHFTNVYFLELPDNEYKTEIRKFGTTDLIDYTASEGDIVTFPGFLQHRSPVLESDKRKTIISFNISLVS